MQRTQQTQSLLTDIYLLAAPYPAWKWGTYLPTTALNLRFWVTWPVRGDRQCNEKLEATNLNTLTA